MRMLESGLGFPRFRLPAYFIAHPKVQNRFGLLTFLTNGALHHSQDISTVEIAGIDVSPVVGPDRVVFGTDESAEFVIHPNQSGVSLLSKIMRDWFELHDIIFGSYRSDFYV
jgi:hypothetical protein